MNGVFFSSCGMFVKIKTYFIDCSYTLRHTFKHVFVDYDVSVTNN